MSNLDRFPLAAELNKPNLPNPVRVNNSKYADIEDRKFGCLKFREGAPNHPSTRQRRAIFDCDCGNEKLAVVASVKSGNLQSCGHLRGYRAKVKPAPKKRILQSPTPPYPTS